MNRVAVLLLLILTGVSHAQLEIPSEVPVGTGAVLYDIKGEPGVETRAAIVPAGEAAEALLAQVPRIEAEFRRNNMPFSMHFLTTREHARNMLRDRKMGNLHKWNLIFVVERMRRTVNGYIYGFPDVADINKVLALTVVGRSMLHWAKPGTWMKMQERVNDSAPGQGIMSWMINRGVESAWAKFSLNMSTNIAISSGMFNVTQALMHSDRSYWATFFFSIVPNSAVAAAVNRYTKMPGVNFEGGRVLMSPTQQFAFSAGWNILMASMYPMLLEANTGARVSVSILGAAGALMFFKGPQIVDFIAPAWKPVKALTRQYVIPFTKDLKERVLEYNELAREGKVAQIYDRFEEWATDTHVREINRSSRNMCVLSIQ